MTVPDWLLERYLLDEVDPDERALAEADPDLPHQLAALRSSNDQVLDAYDAHQVAARALRDAAPPGAHPWSRRRWLVVPALAAAVAAVVGVRAGSDDGHRAKGGLPPELRVYRQGPGGAVERLADGDLARAGDVLQVELVGGSAVHGWVISVDGRGHVTVHTDGTVTIDLEGRYGAVLVPSDQVLDY